jgi:hypothetical protein
VSIFRRPRRSRASSRTRRAVGARS